MWSGLLRVVSLGLIGFILLCRPGTVAAGSPGTSTLPTLTTVGAVHRLSQDEARRQYPVHVIGTVTYFDPYLNYPRRPIVMVTDATSTIYVALPGMTTLPLRAGARVDVKGVSGPGDFAPTIDGAAIRILGQVPLPPHPPRESLPHMMTGSEDAKWVEMEGIVEAVETVGNNVTLTLALRDGEIAATTVLEPGADYGKLVDAKVHIDGVGGSLFNRKSQIIGNQLLFPNLSTVTVEESARADPFKGAVSPIRKLMTYAPGKELFHRVHVQGQVTLFWPGRLLCLQDASGALCAEVSQTTAVSPGQTADVIGFPQIGNVTPTLRDAIFQPAEGRGSIAPKIVDPDKALDGEYDAQLMQVDGVLIAYERAAQDPTIVVSAGKYTFPVVLPRSAEAHRLLGLKEGSRLRLTGIYSLQADARVFTRHDGYPVAKYFQIMLRSDADVMLLQKPSWWTAEHTLWVLTIALLATMLALGWVTLLSRRVKRQTEQLQHQATHDALTGVWNRGAMLEMLGRECKTSTDSGERIGVLMLDADHFKRINDTHGHLAGDAVLQELARRVQGTIRPNDRVGRYGGEEFLVMLRACDGACLLSWGERVRQVIASNPIQAGDCLLPVTVSIGATLLTKRGTARDALAAVDAAMYRAKVLGRNRVVSTETILPAPEVEHGAPWLLSGSNSPAQPA